MILILKQYLLLLLSVLNLYDRRRVLRGVSFANSSVRKVKNRFLIFSHSTSLDKNMHQEFAQTLYSAYTEKNEQDFSDFFQNFISSLKEKGMMKILPKVLREIESLETKSKGDSKTTVVVKDKNVLDDIKTELQKYSDNFNLENLEVKEDKTMVGGFVLKDKKNMIDKSYKTALINMYNKMVR